MGLFVMCSCLIWSLDQLSSTKEAKETRPCLFRASAWVVDFPENQSKEEMLKAFLYPPSVGCGYQGSPFKNDLRNDL